MLKQNHRLCLLSVLAGVAALIAVAATIDDLGITMDEPHYYESCIQQIAWFRQAAGDFASGNWSAPFSSEVLDRYWNFEIVYNVHPPLYKLCSSLTLVLFEPLLGPMGAYRLAPAVMFSLLVGLLFLTVGRRYGLLAGFWAAAGFALMPRIFGHAHIGATDMPLTLLWFASAVSFHRALESRRMEWAVVFSLVYGLALSTKFTAFVIPLPLLLYILLSRRFSRSLRPVVIALVVSPLVMIALNPQWWHSTFERVYFYLANSATRSEYLHIPTYYLGRKYDFYLPWHHCLVYTLFTVPPLVLAGFIYGFQHIVRKPLVDLWASHMLIHWLVLMFVMILPGSPGHDGVRLFLPSFAFLALVSAKGFSLFVSDRLPRLFDMIPLRGRRLKDYGAWLLLGTMLVPSAVVLARIHPYELSYYNCLAGGVSGARNLGMETTYWLDPLNDRACKLINETLPDSSTVFARYLWHYGFLQRLGKIKPSLIFREENVDYMLQYYRQGMFNDHEWLVSRRGVPVMELELDDGIRLMAIYKSPQVLWKILDGLKDSRDPESFYETALIYQMLGMPDRALNPLLEYLKFRPGDFKANMEVAGRLLDRKEPLKALEYLNRVASEPEDLQLWHILMADAHFQLGNNEKAVNCLKEILKQKRLDPMVRMNLGFIYYREGRLEDALEQYETVLRSEPYNDKALRILGYIYEKLGNPGQAKYYYKRLLKVTPGDLPSIVNLGLIERNEGRPAEAERYYLRALEVDGTYLPANFNLAELLVETGRRARAEKHYLVILESHPQDMETHLALGLLYLEDSLRHAEALEHFRIVAGLSPQRAASIEERYIRPLEAELARSAGVP